jgi:hypothetical protein
VLGGFAGASYIYRFGLRGLCAFVVKFVLVSLIVLRLLRLFLAIPVCFVSLPVPDRRYAALLRGEHHSFAAFKRLDRSPSNL